MMRIASRMSFQLSNSLIRTNLSNSKLVKVSVLASYRHSSTNQTNAKKNQQKALKLDPSAKIDCPPPPPPSDSSKGNLLTKMFVVGAAAGIAGFVYFQNYFSDTKEVVKKPKKPEKFRSPENSQNIPKHVPFLLIGGGTASFAAFRAIKSNDARAKVLVISDETVMPYMRPPLSKEVWSDTKLGIEKGRFQQWNGAERSIYYEPEEFYLPAEKLNEAKNGGVSVIRGYSVVNLDINEQKVLLDDDTEITYDKCLIATGSAPKTLDIFDSAPANVKDKISTYKTIKNFETLKERVENSKSVAIVGNGFLGSELACALTYHGKEKNFKVYHIFHESGHMAKVLPEYLSKWTTSKLKEFGVDVLPESQIVGVENYEGNQVKLTLKDGKKVIVDFIVQAVGSQPNIDLAKNAKLEIDSRLGGFVVNAELEARSNLYVAGDVACFYDPKLGRRRVEHHDHAVISGRLAGENMIGLKKPYKHQSMFWSDLGSVVGFEAIGLVDSSLPTVAIFAKQDKSLPSEKDLAGKIEDSKVKADCAPSEENFDKGVLFYMKDDKIVGILLWNVFNKISIARKILLSDDTFSDLNEVAKLFDIFDQHNKIKEEEEEEKKEEH